MTNYLLSLFLSCLASFSTGCSQPEAAQMVQIPVQAKLPVNPAEIPLERKSAARILTSTGGVCSATKISPQAILSASHCFDDAKNIIMIDEDYAVMARVIQDGNDHVIVIVEGVTLKDYATFGPPQKEGDTMHYWGNPYVFNMLLRRGYVSGFSGRSTVYDVNGYHGDSGAGIFNKNNQLTGVISYIHAIESFAVMGSFPLNFTETQLLSVGLKAEPALMSGITASVVMQSH